MYVQGRLSEMWALNLVKTKVLKGKKNSGIFLIYFFGIQDQETHCKSWLVLVGARWRGRALCPAWPYSGRAPWQGLRNVSWVNEWGGSIKVYVTLCGHSFPPPMCPLLWADMELGRLHASRWLEIGQETTPECTGKPQHSVCEWILPSPLLDPIPCHLHIYPVYACESVKTWHVAMQRSLTLSPITL